MREIKFRVWDKESKEMLSDVSLWNDDFTSYLNEHIEYLQDKCELMQYTGLKDKNGVEIYEGDIIKAENHKPSTYEIKFIEGGFCATRNDDDYQIDINLFYPSVGCMIEVIGNIYKNPELLESKWN